MSKIKVLLSIMIVVIGAATVAASSEVDYPENYRSWQHLKTMLIKPDHPLANPFAGIHHIYANSLALEGLDDSQFDSGAIFVFDLLDYTDAENLIAEGERKRIDVMQFDSTRFASTGGWGFETFIGNSKIERLEQDVTTSCFTCHEAVVSAGYVFSGYRP